MSSSSQSKSITQSNGAMLRFIVGGQSVEVNRDAMYEMSPVVRGAVNSANSAINRWIHSSPKECTLQEMRLDQFAPADFELFMWLCEVMICSHPPPCNDASWINDDVVQRVVPIAAHLGVEKLLKMMEEHVQKAPTVATIIAFDACEVGVDWGETAYACLYCGIQSEWLEQVAADASDGTAHEEDRLCPQLARLFPPARSAAPASAGQVVTACQDTNTPLIDHCCIKTTRGLVKYLVECMCTHKCPGGQTCAQFAFGERSAK